MAGIGFGIDINLRGRGNAGRHVDGVTKSVHGLRDASGRFVTQGNRANTTMRKLSLSAKNLRKRMRSAGASVAEASTKLALLAGAGAVPLVLELSRA